MRLALDERAAWDTRKNDVVPGYTVEEQRVIHMKGKTMMRTAAMIEAAEEIRNRPRDVAALHHVQRSRPLKPPRYDFGPRRNVAAAIEARADRKRGLL